MLGSKARQIVWQGNCLVLLGEAASLSFPASHFYSETISCSVIFRYTQQLQRDWWMGFRLKEIQFGEGILWTTGPHWFSGRLSDNLTGYPKMHTIVSMLMYISPCFEESSPTWIFLSLWVHPTKPRSGLGIKKREHRFVWTAWSERSDLVRIEFIP